MSKMIFSAILCVCMLICTVSFADSNTDTYSTEITDEMRIPETTEDDSILFKIWNLSMLRDIAYLRFDFYVGDEYRGMTASCPNEGEEFYLCPYTPESPEELNELKIKCSYGISDLTPEDAIIQLMIGNPAEEHAVDLEDMAACVLECGKVYHLAFAGGSEYAALIVITDNEQE